MTPEEIAQAVYRARNIINYNYSPNADATIVARAVLALTEELEQTRFERSYWRDLSADRRLDVIRGLAKRLTQMRRNYIEAARAADRRTVTPEQIEAVADMLRQPAVTTALGRIMRARMIAKELGLSVDGAE